MKLTVGLIVSRTARSLLGDDLLNQIFNLGNLSYAAEFGNYIVNDLRDNSVQSLVVVSERNNNEINSLLSEIGELTGINPLAVEFVDVEWLQDREQAKALILAYIEKASLSYLTLKVQPVRRKGISRRSFLKMKLYYYKPYPILTQEINFEREINYLTSLCPLIIKTPEGPQVRDPEKCSACGFCSGMSFLGYLEVPNFTTEQFIEFLNALTRYSPKGKKNVLILTCNRLKDFSRVKEISEKINANVYPLITPCIASIHDSFILSAISAGFIPIVYSPDEYCELRDMARLREETMVKRFPGTYATIPIANNENELLNILEKTIDVKSFEGKEIPEEVILGRTRRRALLLWALRSMGEDSNLDDVVPNTYKVVVDTSKCVLCGVCVRSCQMLVFEMKSNSERAELYYDLSYCIGSQRCIRNCPEGAIKLVGFSKLKELGKKKVAEAKVLRCRLCGKPINTLNVKSRVDEMLINAGFTNVVNYTDICNECKQKMLTKIWIERVLSRGGIKR